MPAQATDISLLEDETTGKLVLNGEIKGLCVGSFQAVINAPVDAETVYGRRVRERYRGGKRRQGDIWNVVRPSETGSVLKAKLVCSIGDTGVESDGAFLAEGVCESFAVVVIVDAKAGADGGLWIWCEDYADARGNIIFLLGPIAGLSIGLTGGC